jgi:L-threonylcarbamoyladenylate synthase
MMNPFDVLNAVSAVERSDGVIAFPTDTVYGLGCLPTKLAAVEKIYHLKGRSNEKPLILMSHTQTAMGPFIGDMPPEQAECFNHLAKKYWPGALTIVLPKSEMVPTSITQGHETIGLRVPDSSLLQGLFELLPQHVLATTSANRSNQAECLSASAVFETFGSGLDYILMEDNLCNGKASTVVRIEPKGQLTLLRQGSIMLDY